MRTCKRCRYREVYRNMEFEYVDWCGLLSMVDVIVDPKEEAMECSCYEEAKHIE